ncbi:hypothetical protein CYMTET_29417 [Cymbomonas tetramitiformis]|nr:hypothetical protein CYMTET_29417 [Cymbomonas tetramitiformis]
MIHDGGAFSIEVPGTCGSPSAAGEGAARLVRDNRAADWTPAKETGKHKMLEILDPDFYAAVRADLGVAIGVAGHRRPPTYSGNDGKIMLVLTGRRCVHSLRLPPRCGKEGVGKNYHKYMNCPYGGKGTGGDSAGFCKPVDDEDAPEVMHTLALCHIFQVAADEGAAAFAAALQGVA